MRVLPKKKKKPHFLTLTPVVFPNKISFWGGLNQYVLILVRGGGTPPREGGPKPLFYFSQAFLYFDFYLRVLKAFEFCKIKKKN